MFRNKINGDAYYYTTVPLALNKTRIFLCFAVRCHAKNEKRHIPLYRTHRKFRQNSTCPIDRTPLQSTILPHPYPYTEATSFVIAPISPVTKSRIRLAPYISQPEVTTCAEGEAFQPNSKGPNHDGFVVAWRAMNSPLLLHKPASAF